MDGLWTVVAAAVGAGAVLLGGQLKDRADSRRARAADEVAAIARHEARRRELWNISLPAAARLQETFAHVLRIAERQPEDLNPYAEPTLPFDEGFPDFWTERRRAVVRDIALIPSREVRDALDVACQAVSTAYGLSRAGYAPTYDEAVAKSAQLGFDITSAWLRDETEPVTPLEDEIAHIRTLQSTDT